VKGGIGGRLDVRGSAIGVGTELRFIEALHTNDMFWGVEGTSGAGVQGMDQGWGVGEPKIPRDEGKKRNGGGQK